MYFFRRADGSTVKELLDRLPDPVFKRVVGVLEMISRTPDQRRHYDARLKWELDENSRIQTAFEEGEIKGREEGEVVGKNGMLQDLLSLPQSTDGLTAGCFGCMGRNAISPFFLPVVAPSQGPNPARIPAEISGDLKGFLGVRRAGQQIQLRVDMDIHLQMPEKKDFYSPYSEVNYDAADGHLFYEGQAPKGGLLFMAPIGQHSFNVVLFEVKSEQ